MRGAGRLIRASVRHDLAVEKEVKYRLRNACLVGVVRDDALPGLKWAVRWWSAHNVAMQPCSGGVASTWWSVGAARGSERGGVGCSVSTQVRSRLSGELRVVVKV